MKLRYEQLSNHLAAKLAPVYCISSNEPWCTKQAQQMIREHANQAGYQERILLVADIQFDWQTLVNATQNLSLFSEKRLIDLRLPNPKLNEVAKSILVNYCKQPPPDTLLLITTSKLEANILKSAWYKGVDKAGVTLQIWPMSLPQYRSWINQQCRSAQVALDAPSIELLIEHTAENCAAAAGEIEKLSLLYGKKPIARQQLSTMLTHGSRYDVFTLVDTALQANSAKVIQILQTLRAEGIAPSIVLWALARELRTLLQLDHQTKQGIELSKIYQQLGIWSNRQAIFKAALARLDNKQLLLLLNQAQQIDSIIKGAVPGNYWDELEAMSLSLAGIQWPEK